jgi:hypothetical protein
VINRNKGGVDSNARAFHEGHWRRLQEDLAPTVHSGILSVLVSLYESKPYRCSDRSPMESGSAYVCSEEDVNLGAAMSAFLI